MAGVWVKLGRMLVSDRVLSVEELERALGAQAIYGGRLGTNLVDLQLLSVEEVARYLATQLEVPAVGPRDLLKAPREAVALLTREQCAEHKVFPLAADGDLLKLAMVDPRDDVAKSEIGLLTRMRVVPMVAPELLLLQALEKRYGVKREKRFLRSPQRGPQRGGAAQADPPRTRRPAAISLLMPAAPASSEASEEPPIKPVISQLQSIPGAGEELELAFETEEQTTEYEDSEYIESDTTNQWSRPIDVLDLKSALGSLQRVQDREAVINHLIRCFHPGVTCVLFVIRGPLAVAHVASETEVTREELENLILPVSTASLLEQALTSRMTLSAAAATDPLQAVIARHLGWPDPGEACASPVCHGDEVINLLCVQTPHGTRFPEGFSRDLGRLCEEAGESYGRLVRIHQQGSAEELIPIEAEQVPEIDRGPAEAVLEPEPVTQPQPRREQTPTKEPARPTLYDPRFFITSLASERPTVSLWRAVDTSSQKVVGIHVVPAHVLETDEIQRLTQETQVLQKLSHPNLPKHLGTGITEEGWGYAITEWVDGADLRSRLRADPVPPRADVATIIGGVCGALERAHRQGVFHRDVNPENVMLVSPHHRQAKLMTFGFVRDPSARGVTPDPDDPLFGARGYRAPEVSDGQRGGAPADAYAVGALAFEMLAGRLPPAVIEPIDLATVPSSVRKLVTSALSRDPGRRPPVGELGKQLSQALRGPAPPSAAPRR